MKLRTMEEVKAFKDVLGSCSRSVWLVSPQGEQFDMKSEFDQFRGISRLMEDETDQMELFAADYSDEAKLMGFYRSMRIAA